MYKVILLTLALMFIGCSTTLVNEEKADQDIEFKEVKPGKHAYFNGKTLQWYNDKTFAAALKSGKPLIIEVGRKNCGLCRKFVEQVLPKFKNNVKGFAGVESNVDKMNPTINKLVRKYMRSATLLPVVIVLDKNGKYIGGLYGDIQSQRKKFAALLKKAK